MLKQLVIHAWEEICAIDTAPAQLRKFGFLIGGIFVAIGVYFQWQGGPGVVCISIGAALILGAFVYPRALSVLYRLWMGLAVILGFFVGNTLLITLYYVVLTPMGLMRRMIGSDPLERSFDAKTGTYWQPHLAHESDHLKKPF